MPDTERDDSEFDEEGQNLTQQRIGEGDDVPVDASWDEGDFGDLGETTEDADEDEIES